MVQSNTRYDAPGPFKPAEGWTVERLTQPSRLFGANGLRTGPDGRIYVAQVSGSQISAVDPNTGLVEAISAKGGDIVAPDDLVFDDAGNIFATEITENRVSMRRPNGQTTIVQGDMPCANPITMYRGRLFAGECRVGGRIMELDLNGGAPRIILENVPMPNAMEVGPDGKLYIPIMGTNEIWKVDLAGGAPDVVATGLGVPDSVKFASDGSIVSTQVASGQVLRIDPRSGAQSILAQLTPGLDNCTFVGDRLFVSNISGEIDEILGGGKTRSLVSQGLNWPLGLAVDADGALIIADGPFTYRLLPGGKRETIGFLFTPGCPGYCRGVAALGSGDLLVTTSGGHVVRWNPAKQENEILAQGFTRLYGVAGAPGGAVVFADAASGRVLSAKNGNVEELGTGLREPLGVAITSSGACLASEEGAGRVVKFSGGRVETVLDGLRKPQGILVRGEVLYVVDAGSKDVIAYDMAAKTRSILASGLPVGAPAGVTPKFLGPIGDMSGPMGPFAGIAAGADGTLYVSGDAEGSVLALRRA